MTVKIICADALAALQDMPERSVHTCVTSPPYWGLRDYGIGPDALGLEPTPELYVEHVVQVMREVRRVIRDDGTLWLNMGDSYSGSGRGPSSMNPAQEMWNANVPDGLKPKDLCGVPWRVAFALQADGWWLRSDIVWSKPNPMPESVTDRPTRSHEYLFLLAKSARYYYDADAIREPNSDGPFWATHPQGQPAISRTTRYDGSREDGSQPNTWLKNLKPNSGRNRRSVWEIATQPYAKAHFATFPEKLVEPCILAGTSERGCCPECGAPWERVLERMDIVAASHKGSRFDMGKTAARDGGDRVQEGERMESTTTGWRPTCAHEGEPVPCRVLDSFSGSGTVGLVAERLGRHSVLIDASEDYCQMARERTAQMGLFSAGRTPAKKQPVTPSG